METYLKQIGVNIGNDCESLIYSYVEQFYRSKLNAEFKKYYRPLVVCSGNRDYRSQYWMDMHNQHCTIHAKYEHDRYLQTLLFWGSIKKTFKGKRCKKCVKVQSLTEYYNYRGIELVTGESNICLTCHKRGKKC